MSHKLDWAARAWNTAISISDIPDDIVGILYDNMLYCMSPVQRRVFEIVFTKSLNMTKTTSTQVSDELSIPLTSASSVLKYLFDNGIIERVKCFTSDGVHYEYF
jgi:predicted transcriptional regulator